MSFGDDAETAMAQSPRYFVWWYTVKSVALCASVAAVAYLLGVHSRKGR